MMDNTTITNMAEKWSKENSNLGPLGSDARLVTGDYKTDLKIYHFEKDSGLELDISSYRTLRSYKIVDSEKFAWFVLRWL